MRIRFAATAGLVALLLLPAAAGASGLQTAPPPPGGFHAAAAHHAPGSQARMMAREAQPRPAFRAAPEVLGLAGLNGHVYDYGGTGVSDAEVDWFGPTVYAGGYTTTDGSGHYSLSGLPAASGDGALDVYPDATDWNSVWERADLTWADPGPTTFDFRPGATPVSLTRAAVWQGWDYWNAAYVQLWGSDATGDVYTRDSYETSDTTTSPADGTIYDQPGTYTEGTVHFWSDEGLEMTPLALGVTAGATSATLSASQADAQRIDIYSPWWGSGKPGSKVQVVCDGFPAGWMNEISGSSEGPTPAYHDYGALTMQDPNQSFTVTVPKNAPPGYIYDVRAYHDNGAGLLYLATPFQVCTLQASKTTVSPGSSIVVRGVIPIQGHYGSTPGTASSATLYAHAGTASVPKTWTPGKGWHKVRTYKTDRKGAWHTGKLYPLKTLTLVARYPGDTSYLGAFTSTLKIKVN